MVKFKNKLNHEIVLTVPRKNAKISKACRGIKRLRLVLFRCLFFDIEQFQKAVKHNFVAYFSNLMSANIYFDL